MNKVEPARTNPHIGLRSPHACMQVTPNSSAYINACSPHTCRLEEKETRLYTAEQGTEH